MSDHGFSSSPDSALKTARIQVVARSLLETEWFTWQPDGTWQLKDDPEMVDVPRLEQMIASVIDRPDAPWQIARGWCSLMDYPQEAGYVGQLSRMLEESLNRAEPARGIDPAFYREWMIARLIDSYNRSEERKAAGARPVYAREAIAYRDLIVRQMADRERTTQNPWDYTDPSLAVMMTGRLLAENGFDILKEDPDIGPRIYQEFTDNLQKSNAIGLSPLDPRYRDLSVMVNRGTRCAFAIAQKDGVDVAVLADPASAAEVKIAAGHEENGRLVANEADLQSFYNARIDQHALSRLSAWCDLNVLARLAKAMERAEENGLYPAGESRRRLDRCLELAGPILQAMDEEGLMPEARVRSASNDASLWLDAGNVSVKIVDLKDPELTGMVQSQGLTYRLSQRSLTSNRKNLPFDQMRSSPRLAAMLYAYATGKDVPITGTDLLAGQNGRYGDEDMHAYLDKGVQSIYLDVDEKGIRNDPSQGLVYDRILSRILVENNRPKDVVLKDTEEAREKIRGYLDSAGKNLVKRIDPDMLARSIARDQSPDWSEDPVIREFQKELAGSRAADLKAAAHTLVKERLGDLDTGIDPALVAEYQMTDHKQTAIRDILRALKLESKGPEAIRESEPGAGDWYKDQLREFDPATARTIDQVDDRFLQGMMAFTRHQLENAGMTDIRLFMDRDGVIGYSGWLSDSISSVTKKNDSPDMLWQRKQDPRQLARTGKAHSRVMISGQIGQVLSPDENGLLKTRGLSGHDSLIVPGYMATLARQQPGRENDFASRLRLQGYETILKQKITDTIRQDLADASSSRTGPARRIGSATSLDAALRSLYKDRLPMDQREMDAAVGMDSRLRDVILQTRTRHVRLDSAIAKPAGVVSAFIRDEKDSFDLYNDRIRDGYCRVGSCSSILEGRARGIIDPIATSNGAGQGASMYLAADAIVKNGRVIPGKEEFGPLMNHVKDKEGLHDPADRSQMQHGNLLTALNVQKVGIAQVSMGGYTQEDGIVISKAAAHKMRIPDTDEKGNRIIRDLKIGDKLELHGNKGVVSYIADPDVPPADDRQRQIHELFAQNPALEVCMSPHSAPSRKNAGMYRELHKETADLMLDGHVLAKGGIGQGMMTVTDKLGTIKTHIYAGKANEGRKLSSQLVWTLAANGATRILEEAFARNKNSITELRSVLQATGRNIDENGRFAIGLSDKDLAAKRIVHVPARPEGIKSDELVSQIMKELDQDDVVLELPFALAMQKGQPPVMMRQTEHGALLPVLDASFRRGAAWQDGTRREHEYTDRYRAIIKAAIDWQSKDPGSDAAKKLYRKAQGQLEKLVSEIDRTAFDVKNNFFKEKVMSIRMPDSATAIWAEEPGLDLDHIAVSEEMARRMDLKPGDTVVIFRDPQLRASGVTAMTIDHIRPDKLASGIAINPSAVKAMDGDFDGDTIGIFKLETPAQVKDAREHLSYAHHILDQGLLSKDGLHELNFGFGMEPRSAMSHDPELKARYEDLRKEANELYRRYPDAANEKERWPEEERLFARINDLVKDCYDRSVIRDAISFDTPERHIESVVKACIDTGAKGKPKDIVKYAENCDITGVRVENDHLKWDGARFDTLRTPEMISHDRSESQTATAIKSEGTGLAGAQSQTFMAQAMSKEKLDPGLIRRGLDMTYQSTQIILQCKHSADDARRYLSNVMKKTVLAWNDPDQKERPKEDWASRMEAMYKDELGMPMERKVFDTIADGFAVDGKMVSITDQKSREEGQSTLPLLAYPARGGKSCHQRVTDFCHEKRQLFVSGLEKLLEPQQARSQQREFALER